MSSNFVIVNPGTTPVAATASAATATAVNWPFPDQLREFNGIN